VTTPGSPREPRAGAHQLFDELAVGHALSALEPEDDALFTAHLSGCARCQQAITEHATILAQLGRAVPQEEPPPSVLEGIRAAVRDELPPAVPASSIPSSAARAEPVTPGDVRPPAPAATGAAGPVDDLADRRGRVVPVRRSRLLASAAAVLALLIGLGGWNAALQRDNAQRSAQVQNLAGALEALQSPDSRTVRLASPQGEVLAVAVLEGEQVSLVVDGLEPNDPESVYVMWCQNRDGEVQAVGAFDVSSTEVDVRHDLRLATDVDDLTLLMVTREPGRAVPESTSQQILVSGAV
jgi:hypothetical protein